MTDLPPLVVQAAPAFRTRHANPYNATLYEHLAARGVRVEELSVSRLALHPPDVVHVHWPELTFLSGRRWWRTLWRMGTFGAALSVARLRRGTRLVWTVHNLHPHEASTSRLQSRLFWWLWPRMVDGVLTLTTSALDAVRAEHPSLRRVPAAVTPHGDYRAELGRGITRQDARAALGIEPGARLLLFVGQVREYKNVPALVESFSRLPGPDDRLVIAGQAKDAGVRAAVTALAAEDPRVRLELDFQEPARLSAWLSAADAVVLPYSDVLNSGTALLALSADRPVIVPCLGAMPELRDTVGPEWVHTYEGPLDDALRDGLAWAVERPRPPSPDLTAHSWPTIATVTEAAFRRLRRGR